MQNRLNDIGMDTVIFGTVLIISILQVIFAGLFLVCVVDLSDFPSIHKFFSPQTPLLVWEYDVWFLCKTNLGKYRLRDGVSLCGGGVYA